MLVNSLGEMNTKIVLDFLSQLKENNCREWFNAHKDLYQQSRKSFEDMVAKLILKIGEFDEEVKYLTPTDCIFRIYRDIRFSPDKTPYKTHFSAYIAAQGGRKSPLAGYYIHIEPNNSQLGGGVYCPEPDALKKIRLSIYDNYDELKEILDDPEFKNNFGRIYSPEILKKMPLGYPADFEGAEFLKFKHFLVEHRVSDSVLLEKDIAEYASPLFKSLVPFNRFFNYILEE
jgi:uncharacterized protein (TIGR02453 family)